MANVSLRSLLTVVFLTQLCLPNVDASWETVTTSFFDLVFGINNDILLGTGYEGVYRSTDGGKTWSRVRSKLSGFTVKDSLLFAGELGNGLCKSSDSGATWKSVYTYQGNLNVRAVGNFKGRLMAGTDNGVYYSDNSGMKWLNTQAGFDRGDDTVLALYTFDKQIVAKTVQSAYRSLDSGLTWKKISTYFSVNTFTMYGGVYYAGTKQNGLMWSADSGKTWQTVYVGSSFKNIDFLSVYKGNLLFGNSYGLFLSADNGVSWKNLSAESRRYDYPQAIVGDYIYNGTTYPNYGEHRRPMAELIDVATNWPPKPDSSFWIRTNGPQGGKVNSFAILDTVLFAAVSGDAVYRSLDNGTSWQRLSAKGQSLATNGHFIFAANDGVYRSSDFGNTWFDVDNDGVYDITTVGAFKGLLYAGGYLTGVFSTDYGVNWALRRKGLESYLISSFGMVGERLLIGSSDGLYVYNDKGSWVSGCSCQPDWIEMGSFSSVYCFASMGNRVFAGTARGLQYSDDSANTWKGYSDSLLMHGEIKCLAVNGSTVFAGIGNVYRSTNGGTTWIQTISSNTKGRVLSLFDTNGTVFAGFEGGGVYRSTDNGSTWNFSSSGITGSTVNHLVATGNFLFAATAIGIYHTSNNGDNWTEASSGLTNRNISAFSVVNEGLLAGTSGGGIFFWSDNGDKWDNSSSGLTDTCITDLVKIGGIEYAATLKNGIFSSNDNGKNWTRAGFADSTIVSLASSGSRLYCATSHGIYYTDNNGATWKSCTFSSSGYISRIQTIGNSILTKTSSGMNLSLDSGKTWVPPNGIDFSLSTSNSYYSINSIERIDTVFVACVTKFENYTSQGVSHIYRSLDKGANWKLFDSGLPSDVEIISFAAKGDFVFAGTNNNGVWRCPIAQMTGTRHSNVANTAANTASMKISMNHNFMRNLTIRIFLPQESDVIIKVYNLSGREIATVIQRRVGAGAHIFNWNANGIATGCCIMQMRTGSTRIVQPFTAFK